MSPDGMIPGLGRHLVPAILTLVLATSLAGLGLHQLGPSSGGSDSPLVSIARDDTRHFGISDPVDVTLLFSSAPELGRAIEASAKLTSHWADMKNVKIAVRVPPQVTVLSEALSVVSLPRVTSALATFHLTPRIEGLFRISVEVTGDSDQFGRLGGYAQAFLAVPMSGPGRVYIGSPPAPNLASPAVAVESSGGSVQEPIPAPAKIPEAAAGTPLSLPEGFGGSRKGSPKVEPDSHPFFKVTGRWMYWLEDDSTTAPQRWATVQVWDDDAILDDLLWEGLTDSNGQFTSDDIPRAEEWPGGNQDVYVKFLTCNWAVCVTTNLGFTYNWVTSPVTVGSEDVFDAGTLAGSDKFAQRPFEYVNNGWDYAVNRGGLGAVLGQVRVTVPEPVFCTSYTLLDDTIHLCADGVDDKSPDDVNHEYGHYVQDKLFNDIFWPSPGGVHYLCEDDQNRGLSWTEGFADFFGPRANNEIMDSTDVFYNRPWDGSLFSIDMESADTCISSVRGDDNEMRVAWSLWDLADSTDDGPLDRGIARPASTILDAINDCGQSTYRDFYDGGLCNWVSRGNPGYDLLATSYQNTIDYNAPPTVSLTSQTEFTWASGTLTVTASASDVDTAVTEVQFRASYDEVCSGADTLLGTDQSDPFSLTFDSQAITDDASVWVCAQASDNMEESSWTTSISSIGIDNTPASSVLSLSGFAGNGDWYVSDATLTLSASDGLSGVSSIRYRVNGGLWQTYSAPLSLSDGVHTFDYASTDLAGNIETANSVQIRIDPVPPETTPNLGGVSGHNGWYTSTTSVTLSPADATSGVTSVTYRINGGPWQIYTAPLKIDLDGVYIVEYSSVDNAGNVEAIQELIVRVDTVRPEITMIWPAQGSIVVQESVTAQWSTNDEGSGVATCSLALDDLDPVPVGTATSHTLGGLTDGPHRVTVTCADAAGNVVDRTVAFSVDTNLFSSTGPFGPWFLVAVIGLSASGLSALALFWWRRRRGGEFRSER